MKTKSILATLFIFLLTTQIVFSQISFQRNTDEKTIVAKLFETKWNEKDSTFKWMPNVSESVQFNCKPKIDTLFTTIIASFNCKEENVLNKIILTSTNTFNNSCHACQPSLGIIELRLNEETDSLNVTFSNKSVKRFGTWGQAPKDIKLIQIGKDGVMGILIKDGYNGGGIEGESMSIFRNGVEIFDFISYLNQTAFENDNLNPRFSTSIYYDKKSNKIKITKKGKEANKAGKIVKVNSISTYEYDGKLLNEISTVNMLPKK
jgi:hypothetical protein